MDHDFICRLAHPQPRGAIDLANAMPAMLLVKTDFSLKYNTGHAKQALPYAPDFSRI